MHARERDLHHQLAFDLLLILHAHSELAVLARLCLETNLAAVPCCQVNGLPLLLRGSLCAVRVEAVARCQVRRRVHREHVVGLVESCRDFVAVQGLVSARKGADKRVEGFACSWRASRVGVLRLLLLVRLRCYDCRAVLLPKLLSHANRIELGSKRGSRHLKLQRVFDRCCNRFLGFRLRASFARRAWRRLVQELKQSLALLFSAPGLDCFGLGRVGLFQR